MLASNVVAACVLMRYLILAGVYSASNTLELCRKLFSHLFSVIEQTKSLIY